MKMKGIDIIKIIVTVIILWNIYVFWQTNFKDGGPVSKKEFRQYEKEFRAEMKTLNMKLDKNSIKIDTLITDHKEIKSEIDSLLVNGEYIKYNLDSLKTGQIIIYRKLSKLQENKAEDQKFINKLKRLIR